QRGGPVRESDHGQRAPGRRRYQADVPVRSRIFGSRCGPTRRHHPQKGVGGGPKDQRSVDGDGVERRNPMKRAMWIIAVLALGLSLFAQVKETVNVYVVEVPVNVVDSNGNPVRGLTAANFE